MEYYPGHFEHPFDSPENGPKDEDKDKKDKKKTVGPLFPEKKASSKDEKTRSSEKTTRFEVITDFPKAESETKTYLNQPELADEKEAPLEELSENETLQIQQQLASDRRSEIDEQLTDINSEEPENIGDQITDQFLEKVETGQDIGQALTDTIIEQDLDITQEALPPPPVDEAVDNIVAPDEQKSTETVEPVPLTGLNDDPNRMPMVFNGAPRVTPNSEPKQEANPYLSNRQQPLTYSESRPINQAPLENIVDYLIGRRRDRIKAERRFLPIQQKLERRVDSLQWQLSDGEAKLRQLAIDRLKRNDSLKEGKAIGQRGTTVAERLQASKTESRIGLTKPRRAEHLGHVVIDAESGRQKEKISVSQIETMNLQNLLVISDKIIVEGATLRQVYGAHLIGERSLRYLVIEHLSGKDIGKSLKREMVEHEIDFERDPVLRDRPTKSADPDTTDKGKQALQKMLEQAGVPIVEDELLSITKLQIARDEVLKERAAQRRQVVDVVLITTIASLIVVIIFLISRR
ncbi:MAG TPA: hypothetical protein VNE40_03435 [Candidatus Dormibacteraeota bacterium]|nr:hypothetical protein [Candidatus Dormibacteraeota bacterium]